MNSLSGSFELIAAECLDAVVSGRATIEECIAQYPAYGDSLRAMLVIAVGLRQTQQVIRPSASFARQAGASLQARLATSSRPPTSVQTPHPQPRRTIWQRVEWHPVTSLPTAIALASLALSLIGAGIVTAANQSLPGDRLYGLDRALERISLALADDESRPQIQLDIAQERLDEAGQLEELGRDDEANQALDDYQTTIDDLLESNPGEGVTQELTDLENQREELQPDEREKPTPSGDTDPGDPPSGDEGTDPVDTPDEPSGPDAPGKSEDSQGDPQSYDAPGNWQDAPGQTGDTPNGPGNNNAGGNSSDNADDNNAGGNSNENNAGGNSGNNGNGNGGSGNNGNGQSSNSDPPDNSSSGSAYDNGNGSQDVASSTSGQNSQSDNSQNNSQSNNQDNSTGQGNNNAGGQSSNNSGQSSNAGGNSNAKGNNK